MCVCVCVCARVYACVCLCVCARKVTETLFPSYSQPTMQESSVMIKLINCTPKDSDFNLIVKTLCARKAVSEERCSVKPRYDFCVSNTCMGQINTGRQRPVAS